MADACTLSPPLGKIRPRSNSLPSHVLSATAPRALPRRNTPLRAFSCTSERFDFRVRIAYTDDALCANALVNLHALLRAAKQDDESTDANARLAKKALQYRHKLQRVQDTDIDDPAFDVADFMGLAWRKVE